MHTRRRGTRRSRRGGVLVVSLIAVFVVAAMGAGFLRLTSAVMRRNELSIDTKAAFYLAEAGLAEGWQGLLIGKTGNVGTQQAPAKYGQGLFWVEATDNPDGTVTLESTGMSGRGRATLSVVADWPDTAATPMTIFSEEDLAVPERTVVDSYDSAVGPYAPGGNPAAKHPVIVQSNGAIAVGGTSTDPTTIDGNLVSGTASAITVSPDATVTGSTGPSDTPIVLDPVVAPAVTMNPALTHSGPTPLVIAPGTAGFQALTLAPSTAAVVQGPATVVVGDLLVMNRAQLTFDTSGGPIDLYVTGSADLMPTSVLATSGYDATQITLQAAGDIPISLSSSGSFAGIVYAPQSEVAIQEPFQVFGSVVARHIVLSPGVQIHFDENVAAQAIDALIPRLLAWRVIDIPDAVAGSLLVDPFGVLGVDPNTLPSPSNAHKDVNLKIAYVDKMGFAQTYTGPESAFDWTSVQTVKTVSRDAKVVAPAGVKKGGFAAIGF